MTDAIDKLKEEIRATKKQFLEREKELRDLANALVKEKNDEIERLREALQKISNSDRCGCQMECDEMCKIARDALKEKE